MAELDTSQKRILEGIGAADDERDKIVAAEMAGVGDLLHLRWLRATVGIEDASGPALNAGDVLCMETAGGGGWERPIAVRTSLSRSGRWVRLAMRREYLSERYGIALSNIAKPWVGGKSARAIAEGDPKLDISGLDGPVFAGGNREVP